MPQEQQKLLFTKGMNYDNSPEALQDGEGRQRVNVRVLSSDNDENDAAETMLGNTLVSYSLPAGTNKVIGTKEDQKAGKIYYFVWNSAAAHRILEYTIATNTIVLVLAEVSPAVAPLRLNFEVDHLITGISVVELDANNHLLYWTDYYNEPKKINIEKAKYFSIGDYVNGYKNPFDPDITYRIKKPPLFPPTYVWANDSAQLINYLFKKLFKFKVQFVYDDKEVSSWSPESKYIMPSTTGDGQSGEDIATQDNKITITVPTGSTIVTRIRIAAFEVNGTDFKVVADLSKSQLAIADNSTYNFDFFNNGNFILLNREESIKLFDSVPYLSKAEESIDGIRMIDANIVEGFDPVNIDIQMPLSYVASATPTNIFFPSVSSLKSGGEFDIGIVYYEGKGNRSGVSNVVQGKSTQLVNDRYGTTLAIPFITDPLQNPARVAPDQGLNYIPKVSMEIYNPPPPNATHYQIVRSKNNAMDRWIQFAAQNVVYMSQDRVTPAVSAAASVYVSVTILNIAARYKEENPNSLLTYSFVAGDRIRFIANPNWNVLTPTAGALAPAGANYISYTNPSFLTTFPAVIGVTGNYWSAIFGFNDAEVVAYDSSTGVLLLKTNATVPNNLLPGVLFELYSPAENVINGNELTYEMGECRAITTDAYGNLVHDGTTPQKFVAFTSSSFVGSSYTLVVPTGHGLLATQKVKFYNAGYSVYGVISSVTATTVVVDITGFTIVGLYTSAAGTISRAALFDLSGGDNFKRYQDMPFILPGFTSVWRMYGWVDAMNVSNMFASKAWDVGRPNRIDPEHRRIARPTTAYFTENFIAETNINGLSTIYDSSFQSYDNKFGSIQRIYYENHRLIVFQELKVGQVPIQQIVYSDLQLNDTVGASSVVLSPTIVYYMGEYGIGKNPESFAVFAQAKYFIDIRRGVVLRLSTDGLTPISITAKMHNYFTDKCKSVLAAGGVPKIYGTFDVKFKEYIISFETIGEVTGETLAFNETENYWSTFYSFLPDFMCGADSNIVTFKNGALYVHNTNALHNNFYGVQYKSVLNAVVNKFPSNIKVFQALSEETSSPWEILMTTPSGQSTQMVAANFQEKEKFQYVTVKRDVNTPNVGIYPIINGNPMRGQTSLVRLEYPGTNYNKLFAVNVLFENSERSNH